MTINWVPDTDAQINALKAGETHMIWTQPQVQFEELNVDDRFEIVVSATSSFEHWSFNVHNVHRSSIYHVGSAGSTTTTERHGSRRRFRSFCRPSTRLNRTTPPSQRYHKSVV